MSTITNLNRQDNRVSEEVVTRKLVHPGGLLKSKRHFVLLALGLLGLLFGGHSALAQSAPVQLIPSNNPAALSFAGHGFATGGILSMTGTDAYSNSFPFSQGWEIKVNTATSPINNVLLAAGTTGTTTVAKGDLLVATFYYRRVDSATNEANFNVHVQETSNYIPALDLQMRGRTMWRKASIPFTAVVAAPTQGLAIMFEFGAQVQTIDIAGVSLVDYGQCSLFGVGNVDASSSEAFNFYGVNSSNPSYGTETTETSSYPAGYTQATQFNVTTLPPAGWYVRMDGAVPGAINKGDHLVAIYWTRSSSLPSGTLFGASGIGFLGTGNGAVNEWGSGDMMVDGGWKQWIAPFTASASHAANTLVCQIQAGNEVQGLQIAGIQLLDLAQTQMDAVTADNLTGTLYDYPGREIGNTWRANADAQIKANRQGPINFTVTDGNGNPVAGDTVTANLKRNAFNFGVQTSTYPIAQQNNATFEGELLNLGNSSEIGSYKWGWWDYPTNPTQQRQWMYQTMTWMRSHGIYNLRAHNLFWPSYAASPGTAAGQSAAQLTSEMTFHVTDEAACTTAGTVVKSYLPIWDFVNEPWDHEDIENGIAGHAVFPSGSGPQENECLTLADRDAGAAYMQTWTNTMHSLATGDTFPKLFINDWGLIEGYPEVYPSGVDPHRDYDLELLKQLGAAVDGIGFESHFAETCTPPLNVKTVLDKYVAANSKIKEEVTEYDQPIPDVGQANIIYGLGPQGNGAVPSDVLSEAVYGQLQADWLTDYLTMMFSEPNTDFFDLWEISDGVAPDHTGLMYTAAGNHKLSYEAWDSLTSVTHGKWTTINQSATSITGTATISGCFLGRYDLTVSNSTMKKDFFVDLTTTVGVNLSLQLSGTTTASNVWTYEAERPSNAIYSPIVVASDTAGASGGSYIWDDPSTGTNNNNASAPPEFRIDTEATGSVYVWVRTIAPDGNHDSFWMGVDGATPQLYALFDTTYWNWSRFSATPITLSANTDFPGHTGHTLYFSHRETGVKLDQVLITDDPNFKPYPHNGF
jgi:hypothetical protein